MSAEETGGEEGRVEVALDNKFHTKVVNYSVSSQVCIDKSYLPIITDKGSCKGKITLMEKTGYNAVLTYLFIYSISRLKFLQIPVRKYKLFRM